ncbi:MAG TPA: sulfite exporter TauE/SafE family protein [Flavobacteriales bacterium]
MNGMLATAFVLGAAGSAHCVGMCGPIALAVPFRGSTPQQRWSSTLLLNGGRLTSYALLGAVVGTFGMGLRLVGLQQVVSIGTGALLLLSILVPGLLERFSPTGRIALALGRGRALLARNLRRTAPEALFFTGMLNGLLPCGLLYAALLGAASAPSASEGALFMAVFALGTWPALFALRMGGSRIDGAWRIRFRRLAPVLVPAMAVLMILRGLGLGIPYVSPSAPITPAEVTACH